MLVTPKPVQPKRIKEDYNWYDDTRQFTVGIIENGVKTTYALTLQSQPFDASLPTK